MRTYKYERGIADCNIMNRIVIVGNGFDLSHRLATRYSDFIKWYWDQWVLWLQNNTSRKVSDDLCIFKTEGDPWSVLLYPLISPYKKLSGEELLEMISTLPGSCSLEKSPLLQRITTSIETMNWVDIENEYYKILKIYSKQHVELKHIQQLNKELNYIRHRLLEYFRAINCADIMPNGSIAKKMLSPISVDEISVSRIPEFKQYIINGYKDDKALRHKAARYHEPYDGITMEMSTFECIYQDQINNAGLESIPLNSFPGIFKKPERIMLLNFNYTHIADQCLPISSEFEVNHIHGDISYPETVIFGYGDELDDEYKNILSRNENCYLDNIKSIKYLESPNYRRLLQFIESSPFQVHIMGHSCGNSDRTLLNTIFEHDNCISVKPYYYVKKDGTDNFMELIQNISRNFTDMKKMRDRVVNKTYCEPLV